MNFKDFIKGSSEEEKLYIENLIANFSDDEKEMFLAKYNTKRKNTFTYIFLALFGFIGFAGFHRFYTNNMMMGLLEFFTFGFLFVGTIVDLLNFWKILSAANIQVAEVLAFETKNYYFQLNKNNSTDNSPQRYV